MPSTLSCDTSSAQRSELLTSTTWQFVRARGGAPPPRSGSAPSVRRSESLSEPSLQEAGSPPPESSLTVPSPHRLPAWPSSYEAASRGETWQRSGPPRSVTSAQLMASVSTHSTLKRETEGLAAPPA